MLDFQVRLGQGLKKSMPCGISMVKCPNVTSVLGRKTSLVVMVNAN